MTELENLISIEITDYIKLKGGKPSAWYIGITEDIERRLFQEHNVDKDIGPFQVNGADSSESARRIEKHFLDQGFKGGSGGGDQNALNVYVYKMTLHTNP